MKIKVKNLKISIAVLLLTIFISGPITANARHDNDDSYSGYGGSQYSSKIDDLDNDVVDDIPVPILFGITLKMISPNFGDERDGGDRTHEGLDIMAPEGAPIVSPTDAVVIRTGDGDNSGLTVTTANPGNETFVYMHLSEISVEAGDVLNAGDIIGYVGDTGNAAAGSYHLHFEIRDEDRDALDPFERINLEFSLKDKISYLEDAIEVVDDENDFIEFIAKTYRTELLQARNAGIELPEEIIEELGISVTVPVTTTIPISVSESDGSFNRSLQLGSIGADVKNLQAFLNTSGFKVAESGAGSPGYETQTFGPATQAALARFQAANGIVPATGYFGPITQTFIASYSPMVPSDVPSNAPGATPLTPVEIPDPVVVQSVRDLELNMEGEDVKALQTYLISKRFRITAGATGYFGQQTKDALIEYQKAYNISPSTGYFGPLTRAQMTSLSIEGLWW